MCLSLASKSGQVVYLAAFNTNKMIRYRYLIMCLFICVGAFTFTHIVFAITNYVWLPVFCTASAMIFFMLENIELNKMLQAKDDEIQALHASALTTLMCRTNELECEVHRLLNPPLRWRKDWKSCTSLP